MATISDRLLDKAKEAAKAILGCVDSKRVRLAALSDLRDEIDVLVDALKSDGEPMDDEDDDL